MARRAALLAAIAGLSLLILPLAPGAAEEALRQEVGILSLVWGDSNPAAPSGQAVVRATLVRPDGSEVPLELDRFANLAVRYFGRSVAVSGRQSGAAGAPLVLESISSASETEAAIDEVAVTGTRRVVFLLLKFSDDTAVPHPPAFYADLVNPDEPPPGALFPTTINGFFKKASYDQFSWNGDVGGDGGIPATDWLTLPFPKSHYAPCGWSGVCANLNAIVQDGMLLGIAEGIDFTVYDNVNFVLSNDLDCCAWGGSTFFQGKIYSATWEPPWGQEAGIYVHEMGHSLGLPHSGWVYEAYDSRWDMMSSGSAASGAVCGSYLSRNSGTVDNLFCSEPGSGYITAHMDRLGWIPEENRIVVDDPWATVSTTLEGAALPLDSELKMAKVCLPDAPCTGPTARYLTVEARVKGLGALSQFDNAIPHDGVILHDFQADRAPIGAGNACFFNSSSGWAVPIDATPGDFDGPPACVDHGGLSNAHWSPGQAYVHPSGLEIRVVSRAGSLFDVTVRNLRLFLDGFESGDVLRWSSSVGAP